MDLATQIRKYKKFRVSKRLFPTKVVNNGTKGVLIIGHQRAKNHLEGVLNRSIGHMVPMHTKTEWVWGELLKT